MSKQHYLCKERYRLELRWDSIEHHADAVASLRDAYFCGPALGIAREISAPDSIQLDITPQHLVVLGTYYMVKLEWESVEYSGDKVFLGGAVLKNDYLDTIHKLEDGDFLLVNTEKHEEEIHVNHLVYDTQIVRRDSTPHCFGN